MSWAVVMAMTASSLGWGALALRATGVLDRLAWCERVAWSFGLGLGLIGWFGFWVALAGGAEPWGFVPVLVAGLPGLWWLRGAGFSPERFSPWTWAMLALALAVMAGDLIEGLAPPTDADSLAYHFAIPRQILREHRLVFVTRAADGAIPLLQQMTFLTALALGGEQAMTLWCGVSGWAAVAATYAIGRRHLSRDWALAGAVAMLTLPAMLYGAGSGQVEARMAAFTAIAAIAVMDARRGPGVGSAVIAGLAAGLCMASKYPGLLVAFLCGLAVLVSRGGLVKALAFAAAGLGAGLQWYGWNWWNTGDPVFPMLFGVVPYHDGVAWNAAQNAAFKEWGARIEAPLPRGVLEILVYPLRVTFFAPEALDAGRTGLGPLPVLLAPFAAVAGWRFRRHPVVRAWGVVAAIGVGFYLIWSVFGASQRVRHYLPFMPLVIVGLLAAAIRTRAASAVAVGLAAVILIQSAGQAVFVRNFAHRLWSGESRGAFIERNVGWSYAVAWANTHLKPGDRVVTNVRQWLYLLEVPTLFVTPNQQAEIEVRADNTDARLFWRQLRAHGITHAMVPSTAAAIVGPDGEGLTGLLGRVAAAGCGRVVAELHGPEPAQSRTLAAGTGTSTVAVMAFGTAGCPLE